MSVSSTDAATMSTTSRELSARSEEVAGIGSWRLGIPDGKLEWSPGMYRLFDVDPEQADIDLARVTAERIHPEDRPLLERINAEVLANGKPHPAEYRVVRRDGSVIRVEARGEQVLGNDGRVIALAGYVRDITALKVAEEAALESEDKFRYVFDHSCVPKSLTKPAGEINVNQAFLDLLGYTREELEQRNTWQAVTHPDDVAATDAIVQSLIAGECESARFEKRYVRKDGSVVWADVSTSLRRTPTGEPDYFMTVLVDITDRKTAEARLAQKTRALTVLSECNELLLRATDAAQLFDGVCRVIVDEGHYRMAWVGVARDDPEHTIEPVAHAGHDSGFLSQTRFSWAEGNDYPSARAIRTGEVACVYDAASASEIHDFRDAALVRGYNAAASFPLTNADDHAYAALTIIADDTKSFDDDEMALLRELAADISFGIQTLESEGRRAEAERELGESNVRLRGLFASLTETLGRVAEFRDPYTQGHEERVAAIALAIAHEMGMPSEEARGIEVAGLVHDIGKLSVPAEILTKPGALTEHELSLIRDHAVSGHTILDGIPFPWPIAEMVLQHHERMDGSGYPAELSGDEILVGARILAVADVLEAMSSHRPYRPALGIHRAIQEVSVAAPERYDPSVVAAAVRLYEGGRLPV